MLEKHVLGKKGEKIAENYFLENSYSILEKNWRYLKAEIDLIVKKGDLIVFVEVKTRSSNEYGDPESFVSNKQEKMIINAANEYIMRNAIESEARFDIFSIIISNKTEVIKHIEEAFYPTL